MGDRSAGWDDVVDAFALARSSIGADLVCRWADDHLPPGGSILDIGCGTGAPIANSLAMGGYEVFGVDASPRMVAEFRRSLPSAKVSCACALKSDFFGRRFDGVIAIGLLFLLSAGAQRALLSKLAEAIEAHGHLLFSAPLLRCRWRDELTDRTSRSLGETAYRRLLNQLKMEVVELLVDEGGNEYFHVVRRASE